MFEQRSDSNLPAVPRVLSSGKAINVLEKDKLLSQLVTHAGWQRQQQVVGFRFLTAFLWWININLKSFSPITDPCGTPNSISDGLEKRGSTEITRPDKYDRNQE